MRLMIAGKFIYPWYEEACAKAIENLGYDCYRFKWFQYFNNPIGKAEVHTSISGPSTLISNLALLQFFKRHMPDVLIVWRGCHITAKVIQKLKHVNPKCCVVSYNNDDPFSENYYLESNSFHHKNLWARFIDALPHYDMSFVYREINVPEYKKAGAKNVHILLPYFVPELHHPISLDPIDCRFYNCDVVFIGHYEADNRESYLRRLFQAGLDVKIFGNNWPPSVLKSISPNMDLVEPALGGEYRKAICGAKICLSFHSKLNRDTYTRRSFEIPACGGLLLSERTTSMMKYFEEDIEAIYFDSGDELLDKCKYLIKDERFRERVAQAGFLKVKKCGHDVDSRMRNMISVIQSHKDHDLNVL